MLRSSHKMEVPWNQLVTMLNRKRNIIDPLLYWKNIDPKNRNDYEFGTRQAKGLSFHSIEENRRYPCFFSRRHLAKLIFQWGPLWPWLYGSWIYNYLCNQCLSPLMWVWISIRARCTTLCDKVYQWPATGRWFSTGPPVSSTNKTDHHYITEILLKVVLNTIKQTNNIFQWYSGEITSPFFKFEF